MRSTKDDTEYDSDVTNLRKWLLRFKEQETQKLI